MTGRRCARVAGSCDEGANGGAVVSSVRRGVLDVRIEAASRQAFRLGEAGGWCARLTGSGPPLSAFCRICPREENYLCSSQIRPLKVGDGRVEEANFDHVEFKLTGEERGTTAV